MGQANITIQNVLLSRNATGADAGSRYHMYLHDTGDQQIPSLHISDCRFQGGDYAAIIKNVRSAWLLDNISDVPLAITDVTHLVRRGGIWGSVKDGLDLPIVTTTSNYLASETDFTILVDAFAGPVTVTLPIAAANPGRLINVARIDGSGHPATVESVGADRVDGASSKVLVTQWQSFQLQSDGASLWKSL
jgi:hypothetical protein